MGKKSKANKRADRESRAVELEAASSSVNAVQEKSSDDLFSIDTEGTTSKKKRRLVSDISRGVVSETSLSSSKGGRVSVVDRKAERIAKGKTAQEITKIVQRGKKKLENSKRRPKKVRWRELFPGSVVLYLDSRHF